MEVTLQMGVSGALMGLVYALIAYGFQLTFATSKSINFGQGELVMLSAFVSLTLTNIGLPYWLMVPAGLLCGVVLGLAVERLAVRLALEDLKEPVKGVISTWKHPYSTWNPADEQTHEAFRRENVVMGMVKDGRVVFGNEADKQRLIKQEK